MKLLTLCFILLFVVIQSDGNKVRLFPGRLVPRFEYFKPCENVSTGFQMNTLDIETLKGTNTIVMKADSVLIRKVNRITKVLVIIKNCEDRTVGSCQLFQTWRLGDEACGMMESKYQFWSTIFRRVQPELRCPINPGPYILRNGTIDVGLLTQLPFPLEKYLWRTRLECYDPELFACADMGVRYLRVRATKT